MDLDLGNVVIWMIKTSSMIVEGMLKTYRYKQKSKTRDERNPDKDT
jgi:hypothetical protein